MNGFSALILALAFAALATIIWRDVEAWFRGDA